MKKIEARKRGLYLDYYPPITNPETLQQTRREHLGLYIYEKPKTEAEKEHNRETKALGENIKAQRQLEVQQGAFGFVPLRNKQKISSSILSKSSKPKRNTRRAIIRFGS